MKFAVGITVCCFLAVGCASSGPPVSNAEIAQAESDIRAAENATATEHARELLDRARGDLVIAQREWHDHHWDEARRRIAETRAAASAAESKARTAGIEKQIADLKLQIDDLERRTREIAPREP